MSEEKSKNYNNRRRNVEMDKHIGNRAFILRKVRDIKIKDVADAIGVSFQQLQKYEKGQNRIAASTLYDLANFFKVPTDLFYADYSLLTYKKPEPKILIQEMKLMCAIHDIGDTQTRQTIIAQILPLIEALDFYHRDRRIQEKCEEMLEEHKQ